MFRVNRNWSRDANVDGNVARFINHSCKPNCWVDVVDKTIWIRAARSIEPGEELTYDYNTEGDKTIPCRCRPGCKTQAVTAATLGALSSLALALHRRRGSRRRRAGASATCAAPAPRSSRSRCSRRRAPRSAPRHPRYAGSARLADQDRHAGRRAREPGDRARHRRGSAAAVTTVDGRRYVCSHPDLKRPLNASRGAGVFVQRLLRVARAAPAARGVNDVRRQRRDCRRSPPMRTMPRRWSAWTGRARHAARAARRGRAAGRRSIAIGRSRWRSRRGGCCSTGLSGAARLRHGIRARRSRRSRRSAKTGTAPMPGGAFMGMVVALDAGRRADARRSSSWRRARPDSMRRRSRPTAHRRRPRRARPRRRADPTDRQTPPPVCRSRSRIGRSGARRTVGRARRRSRTLRARGLHRARGRGRRRAACGATPRSRRWPSRRERLRSPTCNRHRREGYDFCDTTHCQVFRAPTEASRRAAEATAGQVLLHEGQPATVFYSALCGGTSELASEVWPGAVDYARQPHDDEACEDEPAWESEMRVDQIERALRDAGLRGGRLRNLRVRAAQSRRAAWRGCRSRGSRQARSPATTSGWRSAVSPVGSASRARRSRCDATGIGLPVPRPRLRPWRRAVRDRRGPARRGWRGGRRDPAVLLSDAAGRR